LVDDPKLTFSITDRACEFLNQRANDHHPFFLQLSYYAIHEDNQTLATTHDKYAKKGTPPTQIEPDMAAMLDDLNTAMDRLLGKIDQLGLADNTYVIFTSDNGANTKLYEGNDHSLPTVNYPLRDGKQSLYEGGIRVPFIIRGPGIKPGTVSRVPISGYDLLPTVYDLAGGRNSLPEDLDGASYSDILKNAGVGEVKRSLPGLVFHFVTASAIRVGEYKLIVHWSKDIRKELYHLGNDIGEQNNLAESEPAKTDELFSLLSNYLASTNAERPKGLDRFVSTAVSKKHPNIVIILVDDMGYGDPGCYNPDSKISTPNIDRLAREGMRFTDAHAAGTTCVPSRYGLMTGQYPWRLGGEKWRLRASPIL
jgi:arylsulfatase A-like enzyme